jgi:hypothetical protein
MLPDFPKLTNEMDDWLTRFLQERVLFHSGIVRDISRHVEFTKQQYENSERNAADTCNLSDRF